MSSQAPSSSLSTLPPTFQENGPPAQFLEWMKDQLATLLGTPEVVLKDHRIQWVKTMASLLIVLALPSPSEIPWLAIHEQNKFVEHALELVAHAIQRVPSLFAGDQLLAEALFARIASLGTTLDLWIDVNPPPESDYLGPIELYEKARAVSVAVLRTLGDEILPAAGAKSRQLMKDLITRCLQIVNDLLSPPETMSYPTSLSFHVSGAVVDYLDKLSQSSYFRISDHSQVPLVLSFLLDICLTTLTTTATHWWFSTDLTREVFQVAHKAHDQLFSGRSVIGTARFRAIGRMCSCLTSVHASNGFPEAAGQCCTRLLLYRLLNGPDPSWEKTDVALAETLRSLRLGTHNKADISAVIQGLQVENWGEDGDTLRTLCEAYLLAFVPSLDEVSLHEIAAVFTEMKAPLYPALSDAVNNRLVALAASRTLDVPTEAKKPMLYMAVCEVVQVIVEPHVVGWMDEDGTVMRSYLIQRSLDEINRRFEQKPVWNTAPTALESLAKKLGDLPCLLFHGTDNCSSDSNNDKDNHGVSFVSVYLKVAFRIIEAFEPSQVHPGVYVAVYNALARSIRHHTANVDEHLFEDLTGFITRGMKEQERSVRLAAGRALVEVGNFLQRPAQYSPEFTVVMFDKINNLLRHRHNQKRETAIVTVGLIAKVSTGIILRESICTLVFQLGQSNPILKGVARLQLQSLAKLSNKTLYNLTSPHFDRIAPYLVGRLATESSGLLEFCSLLSMTEHDFIEMTLKHSLPRLFAEENTTVLQIVAKHVHQGKENIGMLFLGQGQFILAHVFMLPGVSQTPKALRFILKTIRGSAYEPEGVSIGSVVRSCIIPLLTDLLTHLGDEDPDVADRALKGLRKVTREVEKEPDQESDLTLSAFLEDHKQGVVSTLTDIFQEIRGKQSIETRQKVLRSFGEFSKLVGKTINTVAPQIMAALQAALITPQFSDAALSSWYPFLVTLEPKHSAQYIGPTSASFVSFWNSFSERGREMAKRCLHLMIVERGAELGAQLGEVVDLSSVPVLAELNQHLSALRAHWTPDKRLSALSERLDSDILVVAVQSAMELKTFLLAGDESYIRSLTVGDAFHPLVGNLLSVLYRAVCRDGVGEGLDKLRQLAFECIGIVGAVDPDRFEMHTHDKQSIMISDFTNEEETIAFALHLIQNVLVRAYRFTTDIKYQSYLAYAIQELLGVCKFTEGLIGPRSSTLPSIPMKVRERWNRLPKVVLETVAPLLGSRFTLHFKAVAGADYPIYPKQPTYRQWVQALTSDLICKVSTQPAAKIFWVFIPIVRNKDVSVAHHILPYLILHLLTSGTKDERKSIQESIQTELLTVLEDQVDPKSTTSPDKKLLSAQMVFVLLDHLNKWIRAVRQYIAKQTEAKRPSRNSEIPADSATKNRLQDVDSVLSMLDQTLMAKAAFQCKAYARSLMNLERHIMEKRQAEFNIGATELQDHYERLHEMYAHLDEPDGMEGISTMILSPTLEHQIREHESTGKWTSAQSCWEVRLQHEPDNLNYHLGLLRCLRNLGHYDSLRTHVKGVLTRNPHWGPHLVGYQVESEWMMGHWEDVQSLVSQTDARPPLVLLAQVLLAMRSGDNAMIASSLIEARNALGTAIIAYGVTGYRRSYDAVLDLHLVHELELINGIVKDLPTEPELARSTGGDQNFKKLLHRLAARFDSTLPSFRIREPILNMRRTALNLGGLHSTEARDALGKLWLNSAKIARKAGHLQTAYSAILQAQRNETPFSFVESAKLLRARGDPLRGLQELENSMKSSDLDAQALIKLYAPIEDPKTPKEGSKTPKEVPKVIIEVPKAIVEVPKVITEEMIMKAKIYTLHGRWMAGSERFEDSRVCKEFKAGSLIIGERESGLFHLGQFQDDCFRMLSRAEQKSRGGLMNLQTVSCFTSALRHGSKYIYQTLPRILTLWLDWSEREDSQGEKNNKRDHNKRENNKQGDNKQGDNKQGDNKQGGTVTVFSAINSLVSSAINEIPTYKWYTAFPQIVSRIGIENKTAYEVLSRLILKVIKEFPKQALWLFTAVAKSTANQRVQKSTDILRKLNSLHKNYAANIAHIMAKFTDELLRLCYRDAHTTKAFRLGAEFPALKKLMKTSGAREILIPLQESLTANIPPASTSNKTHQPFPTAAPTFEAFGEEIDVMSSMAKPKKMSIRGSNGQMYIFLGKKEDLRKDGRLMDFNAILNKLLKSDSESRRRQLNIRTYGVVSLNEECGLIQWVPNTIPVRNVLTDLNLRRGKEIWPKDDEWKDILASIKLKLIDREAGVIFAEKLLPKLQPVLHEWFIDTFPEPSLWLASRTTYSRTAAVMSMVGYIVGLGDRHTENILLDTNTGDLIHVDFDCLFERGQVLETPEIVPFRLTQNLVHGFGVTGVEGVFRMACEVTLRLLRENKDCLMNVLDAFVHDPLVEWEEKRRRLARMNPLGVDMRAVSLDALGPIEEKLQGKFKISRLSPGRQLSVGNHVEALISQASDNGNLCRMYIGWAPYL